MEGDDYYAELAFLSIYSLKKHNPNSYVIIVTDNGTKDKIDLTRKIIKDCSNQMITIDSPIELSLIQKSRYLKTSLRKYIDGDFLYIDSDTIITDKLEELNNIESEIAAAYKQDGINWNMINPHFQLMKYNQCRGFEKNDGHGISHFYNAGVVLCRDTKNVHKFFEIWHKQWCESSFKYGYHMDQCDFWITNTQIGNIVDELAGIYNFQSPYPEIALHYFQNCIIFHYFSSIPPNNSFLFSELGFWEDLKENGITTEIEKFVDNIKQSYLDRLLFLNQANKEKYNYPMAYLGSKLSLKYSWTNNLANLIFKLKGIKGLLNI